MLSEEEQQLLHNIYQRNSEPSEPLHDAVAALEQENRALVSRSMQQQTFDIGYLLGLAYRLEAENQRLSASP